MSPPTYGELLAIMSAYHGKPWNGVANSLSAPIRRFCEHLQAQSEAGRLPVLEAWLTLQDDPTAVQAQIDGLVASGLPDATERCATLADVRAYLAAGFPPPPRRRG